MTITLGHHSGIVALHEIPGHGVVFAAGTTVPADAELGYATGCLFVDMDASAGSILHLNVGSATSANFDAVAATVGLPLAGGTMDDAANIAVGTTTGTQIATGATQKLGFFGTTAVVQPADANQADQGAMTTVGSNTGTAAAGLSLIGDTSSVDQSAALMNDLVALQEDISALDVIVTEIRTALVNLGLMKGAA